MQYSEFVGKTRDETLTMVNKYLESIFAKAITMQTEANHLCYWRESLCYEIKKIELLDERLEKLMSVILYNSSVFLETLPKRGSITGFEQKFKKENKAEKYALRRSLMNYIEEHPNSVQLFFSNLNKCKAFISAEAKTWITQKCMWYYEEHEKIRELTEQTKQQVHQEIISLLIESCGDKISSLKDPLFLLKRISECDINTEIYICLRNMKIDTVIELVQHTLDDILNFKVLSNKSISELNELLQLHQLTFSFIISKDVLEEVKRRLKEIE